MPAVVEQAVGAVIRRIGRMLLLTVLVLAGLAVAYIRLSPNDPLVWHIDPAAPGFALPAHWAAFCPADSSRFALTAGTDPVAWLTRLDAEALATPGTRRFAGSPEQGRITWITRSALIGFPDFTTATFRLTPAGPQPCIVARQRFGTFDWGVNQARIAVWAQGVFGLQEPPGRVWLQ